MRFTVDIETTNRCNAKCSFCPREMTPHQGLMKEEVFAQALRRATELRGLLEERFDDAEPWVTMCGLGEPLLHAGVPSFVRRIRAEGFTCSISSNASLLDERTGAALLDAGLSAIFVNAGELDDDYEDVYKLPFERTFDNVARFVAMAGASCDVSIVLVDHHGDPERIRGAEERWRTVGVTRFQRHDLINRSGSLVVDGMQYRHHPYGAEARGLFEARGDAEPVCGVPFVFLFVGYDGNYYLCSSDWEKRAPLGNVFDESFQSTMDRRLAHVTSRLPICENCCHDPRNRLADQLEARAGPDVGDPVEALLVEAGTAGARVLGLAEAFGADLARAREGPGAGDGAAGHPTPDASPGPVPVVLGRRPSPSPAPPVADAPVP